MLTLVTPSWHGPGELVLVHALGRRIERAAGRVDALDLILRHGG